MTGGTLTIKGGHTVTGNGCTLTIGLGATLTLGYGLSVKNFTNGGNIGGSGTLTVTGTLTPGNEIPKLTLSNGATVKAPATQAQVVSTTFTATGAYTIDASEITKAQLDAAEEQRIAVLTVPTSQKGGTWTVVNPPVAGVRAKWVNNGDGTSTLYIAKPTGLMVVFR